MATSSEPQPAAENIEYDDGKVIKDPIHSPMKMRTECIWIIDTPEFQRLRHIKQLGMAYYVFPGASHNRFEHSLGVAHLAEMMVRSLQSDINNGKYKDNSELKGVTIEEDDVLCVTLAGLCHDLGHGPFSHTFEDAMEKLGDKNWKHENRSAEMFEYIMDKHKLHPVILEARYLETKDGGQLETRDERYQRNIKFIKELIRGPSEKNKGKKWPYDGRKEEKSFLFEIVNNTWSGIDVDKWDYFARDSHHLGIQNTFDYRRYMQFARIVKCGDPPRFHICLRDKEAWAVQDLFSTRYMLSRKCYCHQVTKAIDLMVRDAIVAAAEAEDEGTDPAICFTTEKGERFGIKDAWKNMEAYAQMNDSLFHRILYEPRLKKARTIIDRIEKRVIYKCIGKAFIKDHAKYEENEKKHEEDLKSDLGCKSILLKVVKLNYGKAKVKVDQLEFWKSNNRNEAKRMKISNMLPQTLEDVMLYVYLTEPCSKNELRSYHENFVEWRLKEDNFTEI